MNEINWSKDFYSDIFSYLLLGLFFQLYLDARARAILFCARALFNNLTDVCVWFVEWRFDFPLHYFPYSYICVVRNCAHIVGGCS